MSTHKRKLGAGSTQLKETFDAILGIIARVKPKLADLAHSDARSSLEDDLQRLAALGETFTEQRQRTKIAAELADVLDREGVHLWNISGLVREGSGSGDDHRLFAALRLAGFRLIEAGIELKPSVETLINVLQLASKAGTALSDCGKNDIAASVLGSAAKFEDQLRKLHGAADEAAQEQAKAQAILLYYNSRMIAAWRDGNDAIAWFMLEKITKSDEKWLSLIAVSDRELLAAKILEIGKSILKASSRAPGDGATTLGDSKRAQDSVRWIQRAFSLIEKMEDTETPGMAELKRGVLRSLARAYYLSSAIETENLARAEATLQELLSSVDSSSDRMKAEHQQLRWMRLAVLKKQKAPDPVLEQAFESLVDNATFSESEVTEILQELRTMSQQHGLVSNVLKRCIQRLLEGPAEGAEFVDRLLLSLLSHCAKDQDPSQAMKDIEAGCTLLTSAEFELQKIPAMACLAVLWKVGDRLYQNKKWEQAAEWFLAGTHKAFASITHMSGPKCYRKASLCYLEQREYARASQVIRRCPTGQSSTFYLLFLTAVYQGYEEDAVSAIQSMVKAADFDRKMLLVATQLAHESDLKRVLLVSLEALLKTVRSHGSTDSDVEVILLARCIIRLVIRLMKEAPTDRDRALLASTLILHGRTAVSLVETAINGKDAPLVTKDVSWLWRTIYNVAVQGCSDWQNAESDIADLFDLAHAFMVSYTHLTVVSVEREVYLHMIYSAFSSLSARMFLLRLTTPGDGGMTAQQDAILKGIQKLKESIASAKSRSGPGDQSEVDNLDEFLQLAQVFGVEIHCQRREWSDLLSVIKEIGGNSLRSYESIADILWSENDCPIDVLYVALEALLHACLDRGVASIDKFSRWLRAICSILLARNSNSDRPKAVNYVEQAITVLENQTESNLDEYPMDERHWLLSTSYNTGVECLVASQLDQAKRWFEAATVICRFVPDGGRHSEKISETYRRLLDQYTPQLK